MASTYYDQLMLQYYQVLNNAWRDELKDAALVAISMLSETPDHENFTRKHVDAMMDVVKVQLGDEFAAEVTKPTKKFIETCVKLGLNDVADELPAGVSIGRWGARDQQLATKMQQQQVFWVGNHFDADVSKKFSQTLYDAIDQGYTKRMLVSELKNQFAHLGNKSRAYWQGLAEHTALRVREFGRLNAYEKAGARGYKLINPMDERTSEICRALIKENKVYPLDVALDVRDQLLAVEMKPNSLEKAREQIKAIAPWISEKDIIRNKHGEPIGVQGSFTPFPPFHWKCRTETKVVL
jgi:hypothetical protein